MGTEAMINNLEWNGYKGFQVIVILVRLNLYFKVNYIYINLLL